MQNQSFRSSIALASVALVLSMACSESASTPTDGTVSDTGTRDVSPNDAAAVDARIDAAVDSSIADARIDSAIGDSGSSDSAASDAGPTPNLEGTYDTLSMRLNTQSCDPNGAQSENVVPSARYIRLVRNGANYDYYNCSAPNLCASQPLVSGLIPQDGGLVQYTAEYLGSQCSLGRYVHAFEPTAGGYVMTSLFYSGGENEPESQCTETLARSYSAWICDSYQQFVLERVVL